MASLPSIVVIDRDGVLNEDSRDFVKSVAEWIPVPGSLEAIAALTRAGVRVAVVTNQSGVGRGLLDVPTLTAIHARMTSAVRAAGGELAGIYFCPHKPEDDCACRKPRPGMLRALENELGVTLVDQPFIGDRMSDVEAARAVGARAILVRTGSGAAHETAARSQGVPVFDDLRAAVAALLGSRS
jgi:D-glycero-D-manno-heptose 1,7-bisphosphate phosphatase